ncbi:MAG: LacI family DNA-binding transcriptional regulator [bacterium]
MSVTITEIAKKANVSPATVSRVFNKKGNVSEETKNRIFKIAEEMNFKPRKYEKKQDSVMIRNIAVINRFSDVMGNIFYSQVMGGIEKELQEFEDEYNLIFKTIDDKVSDFKKVKKFIKKQEIKGIILVGYGIDKKFIKKLHNLDKPLVLADNNFYENKINCVVNNNLLGAKKIVNFLIKCGHQKIGFLSGPREHLSLMERYRGYREALEENNIKINKDFIRYIDSSSLVVNTGYKVGVQYINNLNKFPTALFAANDELALGFIKAALDNDISVPEDLSVVGFDDIQMSRHFSPSLTTVRIFKGEMGKYVARRLNKLINNEDNLPIKITIPIKLIIRKSVNKIN